MTNGKQPSSSERMAALVEDLELTPLQKQVLRQRWIDQVGWTSRRANRAHNRYLVLRVPTVVGGVLIPALITILLAAGEDKTIPWLFDMPVVWVRLLAFVTSLVVALAAASEETLNYGDHWRHYRKTAELLKSLGWQFLTLGGTFRRYPTHAEAFVPFTERVEQLLSDDLEGFLSLLTTDAAEPRRHEVIA
jgi:hypothetical protein